MQENASSSRRDETEAEKTMKETPRVASRNGHAPERVSKQKSEDVEIKTYYGISRANLSIFGT